MHINLHINLRIQRLLACLLATPLLALAVAQDFNADGKADLIVTKSANDEIHVLYMNGSTVLNDVTVWTLPGWKVIQNGDYNGDGKADLLLRKTLGSSLVLWQNGQGSSPVWSDPDWAVIGSGDFNHDGKADVLYRKNFSTESRMRWGRNKTDKSLSNPLQAFTLPAWVDANWVIDAVGDFNGDATADLLWRNVATHERRIWRPNGTLNNYSLIAIAEGRELLGVGDFNGDGTSDLIDRKLDGTDTKMRIIVNGVITLNQTVSNFVGWWIAAIIDVDGDGKADLIQQKPDNSAYRAWLMNSATVKTNAPLTLDMAYTLAQTKAVEEDRQPPLAPSNLTATPTSTNRIALSWDASTDNVAVKAYWIYRDGQATALAQTTDLTYADLTVTPNTPYRYQIKAIDAAGNLSLPGVSVTKTPAVEGQYQLYSTLSGLGVGKTLVLINSNNEKLTLTRNALATFLSKFNTGTPYAVTVKTQPEGQLCTVSNGNGTVAQQNVTNISVTCTTPRRPIVNYQFTKDNIPVRKDHPRTYITGEALNKQIPACYGLSANAQCKAFFQTAVLDAVSTAIAQSKYLGLPDYLAYLATGNETYNQRAEIAVQAIIDKALITPGGGFHPIPENDLLLIDIYWNLLSRAYKLKFLESIQKNDYFYWNSEGVDRSSSFGYHNAVTVHEQLAAALIAWDDPILSDPEVLANPQKYHQWDLENFIYAAQHQASPDGEWAMLENYLAGSPTFNTALPGTQGGLYDNFGYENSEESNSVMVNMVLKHATGVDYQLNNLRDKNKGVFWQTLKIPHSGWQTNLWNTQYSQTVSEMGRALELTHLYRDGRLKYFAKRVIEAPDWSIPKIAAILYYDYANEISVNGPETLPLSTYFSGGGIVASRANWTNTAAFGTFVSGEHVSRRYSDVNTFTLDRKTTITGIAGARYRFSTFNDLHHDVYTHLSNSKNTLKVCDANETIDFSSTGTPLAPGAGKKIRADSNFCGQIPDGYTLKAIDGSDTGKRKELTMSDIQNMGDITRFEKVEGQYAYALGDGHFNYSPKVKGYERAFVHLFPDTFVIFDRVETANANLKTSILIHTYDGLNASRSPDVSGEALKQWDNQNELIFDNGVDKAVFQTLLPKVKSSKVRGGTTYIRQNAALTANSAMTVNHTFTTPRYLEVSAYDPTNFSTLSGTTITITGNSTTQDNDTETITFTGNSKEQYVPYSNYQGTRTAGSLQSAATEAWPTDLWKGWVALKGSNAYTVITSNTNNTLLGDFTGSAYWQYQIFKYHANSTKKWKTIASVVSNKSLSGVDLSFSAFFDLENVAGDVFTFMPNTDAKSDFYRRTMYTQSGINVGTHTLEIFDNTTTTQHQFLNIIRLGDSGATLPASLTIEGGGFSGTIVNGVQVLFNNTGVFSSGSASIDMQAQTPVTTLLFDLSPNVTYFLKVESGQLLISTLNNGGTQITASANGVIRYTH